MPYGNKTRGITLLINNIIEFLIEKQVDLIIIACGTVSSNIDLDLKRNHNIPIYDIISPTIDYVNKNNYNDLGLIATNMTIKSQIFKSKIKK